MLQSFLLKGLLRSKLKGLPQADQDKIIAMIEKKPELFAEIGQKIQQKSKSGGNMQQVAMDVLKEYQGQLQELMK